MEFTSEETATEFLKKLENFKIQDIKKKYNVLLQLINDILDLDEISQFKSFATFKNITIDDLEAREEIIENVLDKLNVQIKENFNTDIMKLWKHSLEVSKTQAFVKILATLLRKIKYKIILNKYKDKTFIKIVQMSTF